ncbi:MAG TPA: tannase/feruloyl esterase family alpha/beta hydrolase [Burkholderiaceae bacterium]|nr:tannase/feruloyl esterase family alpha/beta hydrolase [Burkholderiaceae bacterium]
MKKKPSRRIALVALALGISGIQSGAAAHDEAARGGRQPVSGAALNQPCESLAASLSVANTVFTASTSVAAGGLTVPGQDIPAHCVLTGSMFNRVSPVDGQTYAIGFEMRLPLEWNGRFFYQANGGLDGSVVTATGNTSGGGPLTSALMQGFAVISSDAGHDGAQNPAFGIDPQARLDYGYQAVGKLTPMAKAVLRAAYGKYPDRSYFGGCSNGGRHTMVAAARYADQYDGFLAGSPGFNLPKAAVRSIYRGQQYAPLAVPGATIPGGPFAGLPDLSGAFTQAERQLVSSRVLGKCDALDGLVDGLVQNVEACQRAFNLDRDVPTCSGARDGTCLSAAQKVAIGNIFAGPKDEHGRPIYASFPFDSGFAASGTPFWEFIAPMILDPGAVGFVFKTPPADPATFIPPVFALTADIDLLAKQIFATNATYTQSGMQFMTPPDPEHLTTLQRRGGKMIVYQGVSDPIFSINDTTRWYEELDAFPMWPDGDRDDRDVAGARSFVRLFRVPGMNHCSGGPATDQFDLLGALVHWVEDGKAPDSVVATARGTGNPGGVNPDLPANWSADRTRPLCAYPRIAVYQGGNVERAESFACR